MRKTMRFSQKETWLELTFINLKEIKFEVNYKCDKTILYYATKSKDTKPN